MKSSWASSFCRVCCDPHDIPLSAVSGFRTVEPFHHSLQKILPYPQDPCMVHIWGFLGYIILMVNVTIYIPYIRILWDSLQKIFVFDPNFSFGALECYTSFSPILHPYLLGFQTIPICSMYGICTNICLKNHPNYQPVMWVHIYQVPGAYGIFYVLLDSVSIIYNLYLTIIDGIVG